MPGEKTTKDLADIKSRGVTPSSAIMPALYSVQGEYGWLSPEAVEAAALALNVPPARVKGTATFYSMYKHKPKGKYIIQLCTNVSCMIFGAETLVELLKDKYGVEPGSTSGDGRFSLVIMECIGACDKAPAMLVNDDFHSDLTKDNIIKILDGYK